VVIPAFNEAGRLPQCVRRVRAYLGTYLRDWEIRIVDDGSTDGTVAAARSAAADDPRVIVQVEPHRGKGGAVRAGMLAAHAPLRFLCDADLSMPIEQIDRFLALAPRHADIVIGSREGAGARRVGEPERRHLMGRAFNLLVQTLVLPGIEDSQCGFKLFTGEAADALFGRATLDGFAFDVEVLALARRAGYRIAPVPITWHFNADSRVSPVLDTLRMARDVVRVVGRRG
jgi:glycosyltransferase involved in cell wall biosynthesis